MSRTRTMDAAMQEAKTHADQYLYGKYSEPHYKMEEESRSVYFFIESPEITISGEEDHC